MQLLNSTTDFFSCNSKKTGSFTFALPSFSIVHQNKKECKSRKIRLKLNENNYLEWFLSAYPTENNDYICLILKPNFQVSSNIDVGFNFSIICKDNKFAKIFKVVLNLKNKFLVNKSEVKKVIKMDRISAHKKIFLPCDILRICCLIEANIIDSVEQKINMNIDKKMEKSLQHENIIGVDFHKESLKKMYIDDTFSDVTFSINEKLLKAHKCLLAAVSPVLKSLLKKEDSTTVIVVSDISYETMTEMLSFIYTKDVSNIHNVAHDLIVAANKYNIQELKNICEDALSQNMNTDNIFKILVIAVENAADKLKKLAVEFVIQNINVLGPKPEYKQVMESYPNIKDLLFWSMTFQKK